MVFHSSLMSEVKYQITFIIISGCRPQSSSSISGCSDYPDRPPSPPHVIVNLKPSPESASSGTALRYDQSKQEMLQPVGGSHNPPIPPTTPDYGLNLIPPVVGSHPMQLEGLETQARCPSGFSFWIISHVSLIFI